MYVVAIKCQKDRISREIILFRCNILHRKWHQNKKVPAFRYFCRQEKKKDRIGRMETNRIGRETGTRYFI